MANNNAEVWIELESRTTEYRVRTFRGKALQHDINSLISGEDIQFIRICNCYWYNDADDEVETGKSQGTFERLGEKVYSNFTGEMFVRCSTILNVAILKSGFDGEPFEL